LAVFSGGFTLEVAEAIGYQLSAIGTQDGQNQASPSDPSPISHHPSPSSVLETIASLTAKSLLQRGDVAGSSRYAMLETIREFGLEQLAASGDEKATRWAHARFFLSLAEAAEAELTGPDQADWLNRLDAEHDNMRAALHWALDRANQDAPESIPDLALRLAAALWRYWWNRGFLAEGRSWLGRALAETPPPPSPGTCPRPPRRGRSGRDPR
jgi:predicted ATPase